VVNNEKHLFSDHFPVDNNFVESLSLTLSICGSDHDRYRHFIIISVSLEQSDVRVFVCKRFSMLNPNANGIENGKEANL